MQIKFIAAAVALSALAIPAQAETVATLDGSFTVIESTAPLGANLKFEYGGNGLIGDLTWPTMGDTPANRAFAMENADHTWLQFDNYKDPGAYGSIVMSSSTALKSVFAVSGYDHDLGTPYEGMEFILWGSNDGASWTEGKISAIYRDGFDTAATAIGYADDYTTQWSFGGGSYKYFAVTGGDHLYDIATGEGEIDALMAPSAVPEPETYAMLLAGLVFIGVANKKRKQKSIEA